MNLPATLAEKAAHYARASRSEATKRAYRSDWADFEAWCVACNANPLPASPELVGLYLAACAGSLKPSTLSRRIVSISAAHRLGGFELDTRHPAIRETLTGIKREHGTARKEKAPLLIGDLRRAVKAAPKLRDRALLLVTFAAALRRSEASAMNIADLTFTEDGLTLFLPRRKNDQEGAGTKIGVPYGSDPATCPVRVLRAYIEERDLGPVFLNQSGGRLGDRSVALIVKRAVSRIGLDPAEFGGHSLRAGFATSAAKAGAPERAIMRQTGHRSLPMLRRYIRDGELFTENAAAVVGL
jgi:integrase